MKGLLIPCIIFLTVSLDIWTESANFTLGLIALIVFAFSIYGCFSIHKRKNLITHNWPTTVRTKFHWLKVFVSSFVCLTLLGWGSWYFLSDPFSIGHLDGFPFFNLIPGMYLFGPLIFITYMFLLNIKMCIKGE